MLRLKAFRKHTAPLELPAGITCIHAVFLVVPIAYAIYAKGPGVNGA